MSGWLAFFFIILPFLFPCYLLVYQAVERSTQHPYAIKKIRATVGIVCACVRISANTHTHTCHFALASPLFVSCVSLSFSLLHSLLYSLSLSCSLHLSLSPLSLPLSNFLPISNFLVCNMLYWVIPSTLFTLLILLPLLSLLTPLPLLILPTL